MLPEEGASLIEPPFYRKGEKGNSGDESELMLMLMLTFTTRV
ncbi:hypothetical protein [Oceanobacillus alkalisoli]|nr:hypothetical protein [Oceanobacillus alkalisoli]